jgi:hypothetical protein
METRKKFNCLEMKQNIQRQVYAETKNMTSQELLLYFNGKNSEKKQKKTKKNSHGNKSTAIHLLANLYNFTMAKIITG